jgi:hypothetical protein
MLNANYNGALIQHMPPAKYFSHIPWPCVWVMTSRYQSAAASYAQVGLVNLGAGAAIDAVALIAQVGRGVHVGKGKRAAQLLLCCSHPWSRNMHACASAEVQVTCQLLLCRHRTRRSGALHVLRDSSVLLCLLSWQSSSYTGLRIVAKDVAVASATLLTATWLRALGQSTSCTSLDDYADGEAR